jgi:diacylglycerol kinase family enzyme
VGKPKEVIASWESARAQSLDLGRAKGPWGDQPFLEGIGIGAVTRVAASMDSGKVESEGQSPIKQARKLLQAALADGSSTWFDVTVDGQSICEKAVLLEIANMPFIGPRVALAPQAHPGDGELDIIWLPEDGRRDLCEWLRGAGEESGDPPVRSCRGSRIQIHHAIGQVRLDDRFWPPRPDPEHDDTAAEIDIAVIEDALSVVVPR